MPTRTRSSTLLRHSGVTSRALMAFGVRSVRGGEVEASARAMEKPSAQKSPWYLQKKNVRLKKSERRERVRRRVILEKQLQI